MQLDISPISSASVEVEQPLRLCEISLLDEMGSDDVEVAKLTRAFVRCSLHPFGADYRTARRQAVLSATGIGSLSYVHPILLNALRVEASAHLAIVRLAADGLVFSRSERWFANSAEARRLESEMVARTYLW